jgi:hypothetical protein
MKPFSYCISQILSLRIFSRFPVLTAIILMLTARRFWRRSSGPMKQRKRVFFLPKTLFAEDLVNVFPANDPDCELWYISRQPLHELANVYLPSNLSEYDYRDASEDVTKAKEALCNHWEQALRIFSRWFRPDAFVTCAYYYRDQREFAAACVSNGIPFVALHKECITSPVSRVAREEVYGRFSGRFTGSLITTYNEDEKKTIVAAGAAPEHLIDVVGCPRMDPIFNRSAVESSTAALFDVVFFSFSKTAYLPVYRKVPRWPARIDGSAISPWDWSALYLRYHRFAVDFARRHPNIRVALKVKTGFNVVDVLDNKSSGTEGLPPNFDVITQGEGGRLAATAKIVCGFNSTVLLEAIASKTPVVVPAFGEPQLGTVAERYGTLRLGNAVMYATSEVLLEQIIKSRVIQTPHRDRPFTRDEIVALEKYVGFADGASGKRMRRSVEKAMHGRAGGAIKSEVNLDSGVRREY